MAFATCLAIRMVKLIMSKYWLSLDACNIIKQVEFCFFFFNEHPPQLETHYLWILNSFKTLSNSVKKKFFYHRFTSFIHQSASNNNKETIHCNEYYIYFRLEGATLFGTLSSGIMLRNFCILSPIVFTRNNAFYM